MGNSADRAWQLSQLMEGVSTAFNPSHCSLSYVQAGHCVSKQIGLPTVRFSLAGSLLPGRRARRARFPTCGVVRIAGYSVVWDLSFPPPLFPLKSTKRSAAAISRSQRSFITFYGALRNILLSAGFPAIFHMIALEQTFAALCKKFLLLLFLNRFDSIRNLFIIFALDFPALKNPILEKTNCCIQPSSHSSHASSSSSNQSGLSS